MSAPVRCFSVGAHSRHSASFVFRGNTRPHSSLPMVVSPPCDSWTILCPLARDLRVPYVLLMRSVVRFAGDVFQESAPYKYVLGTVQTAYICRKVIRGSRTRVSLDCINSLALRPPEESSSPGLRYLNVARYCQHRYCVYHPSLVCVVAFMAYRAS